MATIIKCKMCGGDLVLSQNSTVAICESCGTKQTVPSADNEKKLALFDRANRLRLNNEFDKAYNVYEAIIADFPEEAEAYWGLVLCKYGIEYVDDPATGKKIPTCHRSAYESLREDRDLGLALEYADVIARRLYQEEAKRIEQLRQGIIEVSSKEEPYDIFICYKETDENGKRTLDSVLAQDIYDTLTGRGYRVFFSRISLEDKIGQGYEPYIFAALNSARIMLVVGTDFTHFNAVWVKNEWSRFLKIMAADKGRYLIPCYKNIDVYDLPSEFAKLQAQDLGKVGAMQDLLRGIEKLTTVKPVSAAPQLSEADVKREYLYNSAVELAQKRKPADIQEAIKKLESLGDWKDAPAQLQAAKENLRKAKGRKWKTIISIVLAMAILIGGFCAYAQYNNKMFYYNEALRYESTYSYKEAIWQYEYIRGFKDVEERLVAVEQEYAAWENAMLELLGGAEPGELYTVSYAVDSVPSEEDKWLYEWIQISLGYEMYYDETGTATEYCYSFFSFNDYYDNIPEEQKAVLEAFFGVTNSSTGSSCTVRYDSETKEYLFIDYGSNIRFRGRLNSDGSIFVYNDAGESHTLIPESQFDSYLVETFTPQEESTGKWVWVTEAELKILTSPSIGSDTCGFYEMGDVIEVLAEQNVSGTVWYLTDQGWCMAMYTEPVQ